MDILNEVSLHPMGTGLVFRYFFRQAIMPPNHLRRRALATKHFIDIEVLAVLPDQDNGFKVVLLGILIRRVAIGHQPFAVLDRRQVRPGKVFFAEYPPENDMLVEKFPKGQTAPHVFHFYQYLLPGIPFFPCRDSFFGQVHFVCARIFQGVHLQMCNRFLFRVAFFHIPYDVRQDATFVDAVSDDHKTASPCRGTAV